MKFKFSDFSPNFYGQIDAPTYILYHADGSLVGVLSNVSSATMELKYNEVSTAQITYPEKANGMPQPFYCDLTIGREVEVRPYGRFIISEIEETEEDGVWSKNLQLNSLEYELANKQIVIEEGTYRLYSPTEVSNSILGFVLETTMNWKIGEVSSSLWNKYRTFSQTESGVLDFLYTGIQESYGCVVVFDTQNRTINVYDANSNAAQLPIYLTSESSILKQSLQTNDSEIANKLSVYGADNLTIRDVNPTGSNEIINLGYALSTGDLNGALAQKYIEWKKTILMEQDYYTGIVALRNSAMSNLLVAKAKLTDMEGELTELENTQTATVKMIQQASQPSTIEDLNKRLAEIWNEINSLEAEIKLQSEIIESIQAEYDGYAQSAAEITNELKITSYFTENERKVLDRLFIEGTYTDSTFATFDVDISGSDDMSQNLENIVITFSDATVVKIKMDAGNSHTMLSVSGGNLNISGDLSCQLELMEATIDSWPGNAVMSAFVGSGTFQSTQVDSGNISITIPVALDLNAPLTKMEEHEDIISDEETGVTYTNYYYTGSMVFSNVSADIYMTKNATEYQKYSVAKELYNYASDVLEKMAYPTTEFEIDSVNILYSENFRPFLNKMALGSCLYLKTANDTILKPVLLEIHLDFYNPEKFSLIFSNRFQTKRTDAVSKLSEIIKRTTSSSRSFDLSKYEFGKYETSGASSALADFLKNGMDAAYQQVTAGKDQTVVIDGSGIKIGSDGSTEYIVLSNGMIAIIDTATQETKAAIGHFYNTSTGQMFNGVLADVIGGTLFAGKNMHLECFSPNGEITQFKFDGTGAFLNNSRMYLQSDTGGRIGLDPEHGFIAGTSALFDVTDTGIVKPSCIGDDGELVLDDDGFPENTNVYIGIDGQAYFRGRVYAESGYFRGDVYAENGYFNGEINATSGTFTGTIRAATYLDSSGHNMMNNEKWTADYLDIKGLNVNNNFIVDEFGKVTIRNGSISWGSVTETDELDQSIQNAQNTANTANNNANNAQQSANQAQSAANQAQSAANQAQNAADSAQQSANQALTLAGNASDDAVEAANAVVRLAKGEYTGYSFIDGTNIVSPNIAGGSLRGVEIFGGSYYDLGGKTRLVLNPTSSGGQYADLTLYSGTQAAFKIYDNIGSITLSAYGNQILVSGSAGNATYPQGAWDFSGATVSGIDLTAKFG